LGEALLEARCSAGLTGKEAAGRLDWPPSKISRIENGVVRAHWSDVQDLLDLYSITDEERRTSLIRLAKSLRERGWWRAYGARLTQPYVDYLSLENIARQLWTYQPLVFPGLLQTRGYALALVRRSRLWKDNDDLERFINVRIARRSILTRPSPLPVRAIIGEAALRQSVGGREVMNEQLRHLLRMAALPNVTVLVLPFTSDAATGMFAPFNVLSFSGSGLTEVVFLENLCGGLYLEEQQEIDHYRLAYDHLRTSALPPGESISLIRKVMDETR
jgi:transcriptional regulator with XRE-family HTH domain